MELNITLHITEDNTLVTASKNDVDTILDSENGTATLLARLMNGLEAYTNFFKDAVEHVQMRGHNEMIDYLAGTLAAHLFDIDTTEIDENQTVLLGGVIRQAVDTYKHYFAEGGDT